MSVENNIEGLRVESAENNIGRLNIDNIPDFFREEVCNCPEGKYLENEIRWDNYRSEDISKEDWVKKNLGRDADNLYHMRLSIHIIKRLVEEQNKEKPGFFSEEEQKILMVTASIHDLPEAITGDIPAPKKTAEDDAIELEIMKIILKDNFSKNYPDDFSDEKIETIIGVLGDKNSKLGKAFNASEKINYFWTAVHKAWRKSKKKEGEHKKKLEQLAGEVASNTINDLIEYSKEYSLVRQHLDYYKDDISEVLGETLGENFLNRYEDGKERNSYRAKFVGAEIIWSKELEAYS